VAKYLLPPKGMNQDFVQNPVLVKVQKERPGLLRLGEKVLKSLVMPKGERELGKPTGNIWDGMNIV